MTPQQAWPAELSEGEKVLLADGLIFLSMHHDGQRKEAQKNADDPRFKKHRKSCLGVVAHHTEQLHLIGELAAKVGLRNAWPRAAQSKQGTP